MSNKSIEELEDKMKNLDVENTKRDEYFHDLAEENKIETYTVNEAFKKAGDFGKYQYLVLALELLSAYSMISFIFCVPYFMLNPDMECYINGAWSSCSHKDACSEDYG